MAKGSGTTRSSSSGSPRGLNSESSPRSVSSYRATELVRMTGSNQPNLNTQDNWALEDRLDAQYNVKQNIEPVHRYATFNSVANQSDVNDVLKVLEDRGDRLLVASLVYNTGMALTPTQVVRKSDIVFHRFSAICL